MVPVLFMLTLFIIGDHNCTELELGSVKNDS